MQRLAQEVLLRAWSLAVLAATLTACQVAGGPASTRRPGSTASPAVVAGASAVPSPTASAPTGAASPTTGNPGQPDRVVSLLVAPEQATNTLKGILRLDAAYVVGAGGGNIIASGGGNVLAAGGGKVLAAGGGNVIAAGGGNVLAAGGGNVLASGGGNIIAAGGGNVIAAGGGNLLASGAGQLLASGGGNVIAAGGGNVLASGGGNYRSLQAWMAPPRFQILADAPASGAPLPAAGVVVGLIDLAKGSLVPVGVDFEGKPVEAIYTNERGAFTLHPPEGTTGNFAIVARLPGAERDPRLAYDRLTSGQSTGQVEGDLDEETALVTRFLIESTQSRMIDLLRRIQAANPNDPNSLKAIASSFNSTDEGKNGLIRCLMVEIQGRTAAAKLMDEDYPKVANKQARLVLANFDLAKLTCRQHSGDMPAGQRQPNPEVVNTYFGQTGIIPVMVEALRRTKVQAEAKSQALGSLKALEAIPDLQATGIQFLKSSDVSGAIVARSYANEKLIFDRQAQDSFMALGFSESEAKEVDNAMRSVATGLGVAIGNLMLDGMKSGNPAFLRAFLENVGPSVQADPLASFTGCLLGGKP